MMRLSFFCHNLQTCVLQSHEFPELEEEGETRSVELELLWSPLREDAAS